MVHYLLDIMSSWALVCDIWYLPPVTRQEGETAIEFANRVKADIARQGGLVDLIWYVVLTVYTCIILSFNVVSEG